MQHRWRSHIVYGISRNIVNAKHYIVYTIGVTSFCVRKRNEVDSKLSNEVLALLVTLLCPCGHKHKKLRTSYEVLNFLEATPGFEPGNQGFADPRLTTWLCRRILLRKKGHKKDFSVSFLLERMTRLELATSTLARWRSTR